MSQTRKAFEKATINFVFSFQIMLYHEWGSLYISRQEQLSRGSEISNLLAVRGGWSFAPRVREEVYIEPVRHCTTKTS